MTTAIADPDKPEFSIGDRVIYTGNDYQSIVGRAGVIYRIDPADPVVPYLVDFGDGIDDFWLAPRHMEKSLYQGDEVEDDPVNHPSHYTWLPGGIEVIDITENLNFCRGNAVKYILRAGLKGNERQDLEKAVWYLNREIGRMPSDDDSS